jgi:flagellar basal-body rod protein FlgC
MPAPIGQPGVAMQTAISGLRAQMTRMDAISNNLANRETTRSATGGPYRRKDVVFREMADGSDGVETEIVTDDSPFRLERDPNHPDARADGYVELPNVDIPTEIVNMMYTRNAYSLNIATLKTAGEMQDEILDVLR